MYTFCLMLQLASWQAPYDNAYTLLSQGKYAEAKVGFEAALPLARQQPSTQPALAVTLHALGFIALHQGNLDESRQRFEAALEAMRPVPDSIIGQANIHANLGQTFTQLNRHAEAELHLRRAIEISKAHRPPSDPATAKIQTPLAGVLLETGRLAEALHLLTEARTALLAQSPPSDAAIINNALHLSRALWQSGRGPEARRLIVETERSAAGTEHYADVIGHLGDLYRLDRDYARAMPLLRRALDRARARGDLPGQISALLGLAQIDMAEERPALAEAKFLEALAILERQPHPLRQTVLIQLAYVRSQQGLHQSALQRLDQAALTETHPDAALERFVRAAAELGLGHNSAHTRFLSEAQRMLAAKPPAEQAVVLESYAILLRKINPSAAKLADRQSRALAKALKP